MRVRAQLLAQQPNRGGVRVLKPLYSVQIAGNVVTFAVDEGLRRRKLVRHDLVVEYGDETDLSACPEWLLAIPALANLAPIVWLSGETYSIPVLDAVFADSLERIRRELVARYPEASWDGKLVPDALETPDAMQGSDEDEEPRAGVLFSSGLDSVFTSLAIGGRQLLIAGWGNDVAYENARGWAPIAADIESFARTHGHEPAWFRSNFRRIANEKALAAAGGMFNWWGQVQHGIGLIGLTAPILAGSGIRKLVISSTAPAGDTILWGSDAELVEEMVWNSVSVELYGGDVTRQEKSAFVAAQFASGDGYRPQIHVCWIDPASDGLNCCRCQKCLRTAVSLALEDDQYERYGFPVSEAEASRRLRAALETQTLLVGRVDIDLWAEVQVRIAELLRSSNPDGRRRAEPFRWILDVDFTAYHVKFLKWARLKRPFLRIVGGAPRVEAFARSLVQATRRARGRAY